MSDIYDTGDTYKTETTNPMMSNAAPKSRLSNMGLNNVWGILSLVSSFAVCFGLFMSFISWCVIRGIVASAFSWVCGDALENMLLAWRKVGHLKGSECHFSSVTYAEDGHRVVPYDFDIDYSCNLIQPVCKARTYQAIFTSIDQPILTSFFLFVAFFIFAQGLKQKAAPAMARMGTLFIVVYGFTSGLILSHNQTPMVSLDDSIPFYDVNPMSYDAQSIMPWAIPFNFSPNTIFEIVNPLSQYVEPEDGDYEDYEPESDDYDDGGSNKWTPPNPIYYSEDVEKSYKRNKALQETSTACYAGLIMAYTGLIFKIAFDVLAMD